MLSFALSHVTDEQGINSAMMLCGEGASDAYRLSKWGIKRAWKNRKAHRADDASRPDPLVSDACSAYRGGYTSTNDPDVDTLMRNLSGAENFPGNGEKPFFWTGERDDLSWFWKKTKRNTPTILPTETIDGIPEDALRARVRSTMERARLDGLVDKVSDAYVLTDKGQKAILDPEFIRRRLVKECDLYANAYQNLGEQAKEVQNDRIDRKLEELGRTEEFAGCDRITLNKEKLLVDDTAEDVARFYIPGTGRREVVDIPKADLIELDEKTLCAFLRKGQSYAVNGKPVAEEALFEKFENKNSETLIRTSVERGEKAAAKEMGIAGYDDPDAFFEAALRAGMGDGVANAEAATAPTPDVSKYEVGKEVFVILPDLSDPLILLQDSEIVSYKIDRVVETEEGTHLHMVSKDGTHGDLLLPAEADGHLFADTYDDAFRHAMTDPEDVEKYDSFLRVQTELASISESYLNVRSSQVERTERGYLLHPEDAPFEAVHLDAKDVEMLPDGSANIRLRPDKTYTVTSGDVPYSVSGDGAEHLLKDVSSPVRETGQGMKATEKVAETMVKAAEKATEAAVDAATTATSAVPVAGQVLKVAEEAAKVGLAAAGAVNGLAAGDAKAMVEAAAKVVPGASAATKLGGLTRKL